MKALQILQGLLSQSHGMLEFAVDGLTDEQLRHRFPGATIQPAGPIYVHTIFNEDHFINRMLRGGETIYLSDGWDARIGIDPGSSWQSEEWADSVRLNDLPLFREYAKAVYAASDAYLASLTEDDLDRLIELPHGSMCLAEFLGGVVITHAMVHGSEISAIKGLFGLKGAPY